MAFGDISPVHPCNVEVVRIDGSYHFIDKVDFWKEENQWTKFFHANGSMFFKTDTIASINFSTKI